MDQVQQVILLQDLARALYGHELSKLNLKGLDPLRAEVDTRLHAFRFKEFLKEHEWVGPQTRGQD